MKNAEFSQLREAMSIGANHGGFRQRRFEVAWEIALFIRRTAPRCSSLALHVAGTTALHLASDRTSRSRVLHW